jgi:glyoxylase-like metal-dependent hydrolase (beta-lactamase superfamily II)
MEGRGFEVADGIHRIEAPLGERYVACYLVVGDESALLVDTGTDAAPGGSILPHAATLGIPPERLRYAVVSHCDVDHMGGDAALKAAVPGASLVAHTADRALIEDVERIIEERYREFVPAHGIDIDAATIAWCRSVARAAPVEVVLDGQRTFDLGGRSVEVVPTPGHSPGSITVWDERTRSAMTADAVLGSSIHTADGRPAFAPTYRHVAAYRGTIAALEARRPALLLTAHEPVLEGDAARAFLAESRAFVDRVESEVLAALHGGAGPRTLRELIEIVAPRVGPWDPSAWDTLAYALLGHLEQLEATGRVASDAGRPVRYRVSEART